MNDGNTEREMVPYDFDGTMNTINTLVARLVADDNGQDLIEYALLAALIGVPGSVR